MEDMEIDEESNGNGEEENSYNLRPVAPDESGAGLPYAPEDWPNPGDIWTWRVGKRVAITGHYLDRYLYLPTRLCLGRKKSGFASKLAVERYVKEAFPNEDLDAFFNSFSWRIPANPSSLNGNVRRKIFSPLPSEETAEFSISDTDGVGCRAGNKKCGNLFVQTENTSLPAMPCDICCSEPNFCRDCCCLLCSKTVSSKYGGYSYIKCESVVSDGHICGHVAHINCALRTYMAGCVGGSIGLDAGYYCRRCDARTDLVPHVTMFLQTCESVDSRDEIKKMLSVAICILRGSQRTDANKLLNRVEAANMKLKCGTSLEDIWKGEEDISAISTAVSLNQNATVEAADYEDILDDKSSLPDVVPLSSPHRLETEKLDEEIDQVLEALKKSQEHEYRIAEERLYAQKKYLQNLYQQLDKEKSELSGHVSNSKADDLLSAVMKRVTQIKHEARKLKEMKEVVNGFGRTSKDILQEHFGLEFEK